MRLDKTFTRVVWWRHWKQPQTHVLALGHLSYAGFIFSKTKQNGNSNQKRAFN